MYAPEYFLELAWQPGMLKGQHFLHAVLVRLADQSGVPKLAHALAGFFGQNMPVMAVSTQDLAGTGYLESLRCTLVRLQLSHG
jgi:hypothetical protein